MTLTNSESDVINPTTKPGSYLAAERERKGISIEHLANKLNLRVQVLMHLEADEYHQLPHPVFVKGYIRAYCKHLDLACADELVKVYASFMPAEPKFERQMWQNPAPRESESSERWLHWVAGLFASAAIVAIGLWWYENKPKDGYIPKQLIQSVSNEQAQAAAIQNEKTDVQVTDLSKMRNLLNSRTVEQNITVPAQTE